MFKVTGISSLEAVEGSVNVMIIGLFTHNS